MLLFIIGGISSCHNELDSEDSGNNRGHGVNEKPQMKTLTMSFGGDYISETEEPLQRAEDGETYTAINVYYTKSDTDGAKKEKYAYGLFKGTDPISIVVFTGYEYSFEATILKEREDKVRMLSGGYTDPFRLHDGSSENFDNAWSYISKDLNSFHYTYLIEDDNSRSYFCQLASGTAYVNSGGDLLDGNGNSITVDRWIRYPRVKRFYGKLEKFTPSDDEEEQIEIPMEYKCFGLKIVMESIPEHTYVSIKDVTTYNGPTPTDEPNLVFTKDLKLGLDPEYPNSWECIYSLNNFSTDIQEFSIRFDWMKGAGKSEPVIKKVKVEAKKKKVLKVTFDGETSETKSGNIVFTNMEDDLVEDPESFSYTFGKKN